MMQGLAQGCVVHLQGRKKLRSAELFLDINCGRSVRCPEVFQYVSVSCVHFFSILSSCKNSKEFSSANVWAPSDYDLLFFFNLEPDVTNSKVFCTDRLVGILYRTGVVVILYRT